MATDHVADETQRLMRQNTSLARQNKKLAAAGDEVVMHVALAAKAFEGFTRAYQAGDEGAAVTWLPVLKGALDNIEVAVAIWGATKRGI